MKNFILIIYFNFFLLIFYLYHFGIEQGFIEESLFVDLKMLKFISKEEILKQLQEKNISCKDVTFKIFGLSLTSI